MKKLLVFLFVLGSFSAAFAQEAKKDATFKASATGIVYGTTYQEVNKDVEGDYSASRIRPLFTFSDGNIEAVVKLEIDATFGANPSSNADVEVAGISDKNSENVGVGADKKLIEVANAYVQTKIDGLDGVTLTGGIANYDFPLIFGDNIPLASANYSNNMMDIGLFYLKTAEGSLKSNTDDAQVYIADAKIKFGESSIRPAFFVYQAQKAAVDGTQYRDSKGYIGGLSANIVAGTFGLDLAAAYANGKDKSVPAATVKHTGYAVDFAPYIKIDTIKITPFFTMMSGDSDTTDATNNSFIDATISGTNSGINNWRLYIIEDSGSFTSNTDVANANKYGNSNGYMAYGLSVDGSFGRVSAKLQGAYVVAAKVASGEKDDMGIEIDANVGFALTKSSTLYVEGAFLKTGEYYGDSSTTQNAQYLNVGVTYSI